MSWEQEPLWTKARLYFEQALEYPREDARFGLWCSFGLELLARAAVASVSPVLLAEPDRDQKNLLLVLGRGDARVGAKSVSSAQVVKLCQHLFADFTPVHTRMALALFNRRNAELHTGAAAFTDYTTQQWIAGFYSCCRSLVAALGETLETLLGDDEAQVAASVLAEAEREVRQRVESEIGAYRRVFEDRPQEERSELAAKAEEMVQGLVERRHHKVECPSCRSCATTEGDAFGGAFVSHDDAENEIVVRQAVLPRRFSCPACGLKLEGYAELAAANLGNQYTRTTRYFPEEYFELINPDDAEAVQDLVDRHIQMQGYGEEYDNE